jgi:hypothetical protein
MSKSHNLYRYKLKKGEFVSLPYEIILEMIEKFNDLESIRAFCKSNKKINSICKENKKRIIDNLMKKKFGNTGKVYEELYRVLRLINDPDTSITNTTSVDINKINWKRVSNPRCTFVIRRISQKI